MRLSSSLRSGVLVLLLAALPGRPAEGQSPARPLPTVKDGQLQLSGPIAFAPGSEVLLPQSDEILQSVRDYLVEKSYITLLRIEGHTDRGGAAASNQGLSERRALAVGQWLVGHGIDCHRLIAVGFGGSKPIADDSTAIGQAQNRRIALVNAALRGRPIGGLPVDGGGKVAGELCKSR